ncbi:hypothetical protein PENTCL1PPCAC_19183, partial [Pristionchus entomophagus]
GRVEEVEERVGLHRLGQELAGVGSLLLLLLDDLQGDIHGSDPLNLVASGLGDCGSVVFERLLTIRLHLELVLLREHGVLEVGVLGEVEEDGETLGLDLDGGGDVGQELEDGLVALLDALVDVLSGLEDVEPELGNALLALKSLALLVQLLDLLLGSAVDEGTVGLLGGGL